MNSVTMSWRARKSGVSMSVAHFSPKYCKNWKHEWLAQAEENNIKYDMAVLGMWAWQTKKHCC